MTGDEILTRLSAAGITYRLDAGEIVLTPAGLITTEIKAAILADRAAVVAAIGAATPPSWCTGQNCHRHEIKDLPRRGLTTGCVIPGPGLETWRPLHRMTSCPKRKPTIH